MRPNASFLEAVNIALTSLRSSKLRSFLTLLGIILATATLIAVVGVIDGMDQYIANEVTDMGADGFRVRRLVRLGDRDMKKYLEMQRRNPQLTREEFAFLKENVTLTREIGMESSTSASVRYGSELVEQVILSGVTPNTALISGLQVTHGRFINEIDNRRRRTAVFIGSEIRDRFFPNVDAIGKEIVIDGRPFEVVGVATAIGSVFGQSRDSFLMIPSDTYFKIYGSRRGIGFNAKAVDTAHLAQAQDEVRSLLRTHRGLRPGQEDNFGMVGSDSLMELWNSLTGVIAATAVAVVSVFMVVGGVVIMNIMLAVVTERTHEIGIRKSVGARRQDILNQFLVESSTLAAVGGLIGVTAAWSIAVLVRSFTPVPMAVPISAVLIGVGLSTAVGLFFGVYPAKRASSLDPIEALRFEK